jgi:nicotinic acid mononucleotide adenylyltransferase
MNVDGEKSEIVYKDIPNPNSIAEGDYGETIEIVWKYTPPHSKPADRGVLIMDSSYNPPTLAHLHMILAGIRDSIGTLVLSLSITNVDKMRIGRGSLSQRKEWLLKLAEEVVILHPNVNVIVVVLLDSRLFFQKRRFIAEIVPNPVEMTFLLGDDTLERLFAGQYYVGLDVEQEFKEFFGTSRIIAYARKYELGALSNLLNTWIDQVAISNAELVEAIKRRITFAELDPEYRHISSTLVRDVINEHPSNLADLLTLYTPGRVADLLFKTNQ